ncbi:Ldh family oxidoreductase [Mesorhizobium sp. SB112]|uniref:Ldh family oxidoreductase n=1 Tax=Mesorhizobium sp. SB112 TaxID=3151853 RepID=UPI003262E247
MKTHISHEELTCLTTALFKANGLPQRDADRVAECLVLADLRGVSSHGISRLPIYLERLRSGLVNPNPSLALEEPTPVCALLDGDNGFGFVVATRAMEAAIKRAEKFGIGMVGVKHSAHFGMAACYLLQAIDKGYASFVFTNASPTMPVWGASEPFLGTSPFAFGAPGGKGGLPMILDMATSVVARGKIRRAAALGEPVPEGWALDKDGNPTTDAKKAYDGIILPLGGPKGSALSLMMEVMAGVMTGAAFAGDVGNQYEDMDRPQDVGHCFIAINPKIFMGDDYAERMQTLMTRAKASRPIDPAQPVLAPGEPEALREAERRRTGIPLEEEDIMMLAALADKAGIKADWLNSKKEF